MHLHDHESKDAERQATKHRQEDPTTPLGTALGARRPDVLGSSGLLAVQRAAGNAATAELVEGASPLDVLGSSGQSLDDSLRRDMEARMGHDFSDVRVHNDSAADTSARSVQAHAFTVGSEIVFQRGAYDPGSTHGKTLLAHELTHVVQQRHGSVDGTPTGDGYSVSHPDDRFEREAADNAERVMASSTPATQISATGGTLQREAEEEEDLQASHDNSLPSLQHQDEEHDEPES